MRLLGNDNQTDDQQQQAIQPVKTTAHIPNLFDRSRFGGKVRFVDLADEVDSAGTDLVIVDLDRCDDIASFRLEGPRVIGFGPHVDSRLHQEAVDAGFDEVMPRSVFFRRLPELLDSVSDGPAPNEPQTPAET